MTPSATASPRSARPATPTLWGVGTARTLRPIWLLHELGIDFDLEPVLPRTTAMQGERFRALSERGKVPLLEHGDLVIGESAAITLYLADAYRDRQAFAPAPGTRLRAQHDELCWFTMTEMDAILYIIRRHDSLAETYGAAPAAVASARAYFLRSAEEFERRLADGRPYLMGDAFSVADLLFKTCLDWAVIACQIQLPTALGGYFGVLSARPAYTVAMKSNFPPEAMRALTEGQSK